jgi:hypothetical protein
MSFWRLRLAALLLAALPAFTGWRPPGWSQVLIPGASLGTVLVALGANAVIGLACGPGVLGGALTVAAMMVLAVVFSGATVSCGLYWLGWAYPGGPSDFSPHYLALALNMLTVIPLAVAMVMTLPLERAETALLRSGRPVSPVRKGALMALRVFNHVTFFVIPEILEIVREERMLAPQGLGAWRRVSADLVQLGVAGICGSLQYLPLWAKEIARLPEGRSPRPTPRAARKPPR